MALEDKYLATLAQTAETDGDFYTAWNKMEFREAHSYQVQKFSNTQ